MPSIVCIPCVRRHIILVFRQEPIIAHQTEGDIMSNELTLQELKSYLWESANILRGSIGAEARYVPKYNTNLYDLSTGKSVNSLTCFPSPIDEYCAAFGNPHHTG